MQKKVRFISEIAMALHRCGAASYHIEDASKGIAEKLAGGGEILITPTIFHCSVESPDGKPEIRMERLYPAGFPNMGKLADYDALADAVTDGACSLENGLERVHEIKHSPDSWRPWMMPFAFSLSSGLFCAFFGGRVLEAVISGILGLVVFGLISIPQKFRLGPITEFIGAFVVTLLAHLSMYFFPDLMVDKVVLGSLIVLLPGLSITVALAELSIKHLMSGTARLMGAFIELLKLSLGVFFATSIVTKIVGERHTFATPLMEMFMPEWCALAIVGICLSFLFKVKPRDVVWVVTVTFLGYYGSSIGTDLLGHELGIFIGGTLVSAGSNAFARFFRRPALTTMLPALLPLVPGSIGFKSVSFLFALEVIDSLSNGFDMLIVAISLVAGLSLGHILIHPRRSI